MQLAPKMTRGAAARLLHAARSFHAGGGLLVPVIILISLGVSGCGNKFTGAKQVFTCTDGARVEVVYSKDRDSAMVSLGDKSYKLTRINSGTGVKYSNGRIVFWNKGQGAIVQIDGQVAHDGCRLAE